MFAILRAIPIANTPRKFFASLKHAETGCVIALTLAMSVLLNGKTRCFGVLAAELQNRTCVAVEASCGVAILNWIVFLAETIAVAGRPLLSALLARAHHGAIGGHLTYQASLVLALGACLSGVAADAESLFVTDSLIQGSAAALLLAICVARLTHMFPPTHQSYRATLLLTEISPWLGVLLCPAFGVLLLAYGWQAPYVLIALLVLILCSLAAVVDTQAVRKDDDDDGDASSEESEDEICISNQELASEKPVRNPEHWDTAKSTDYQPNSDGSRPSLMQLLLDMDVVAATSRPVAIVWLVERALFAVAEFGLIVNIVIYMTEVVKEPLYTGSIIMVTLGAGNIMGAVTVFALGSGVRPHLLLLYIISAATLVICFVVWHIYGARYTGLFTAADAHFIVIVIGIFSGAGTAQIHLVAEDVLQRPHFAALTITKLAQTIGLLLGPLASGMVIQLYKFHVFFAIQAFIHAVRVVLLAFIHYKQ